MPFFLCPKESQTPPRKCVFPCKTLAGCLWGTPNVICSFLGGLEVFPIGLLKAALYSCASWVENCGLQSTSHVVPAAFPLLHRAHTAAIKHPRPCMPFAHFLFSAGYLSQLMLWVVHDSIAGADKLIWSSVCCAVLWVGNGSVVRWLLVRALCLFTVDEGVGTSLHVLVWPVRWSGTPLLLKWWRREISICYSLGCFPGEKRVMMKLAFHDYAGWHSCYWRKLLYGWSIRPFFPQASACLTMVSISVLP